MDDQLQQIRFMSLQQTNSSASLASSNEASSNSLSSMNNYNENGHFSSNNFWFKMSECDEFIGPRRSKHTMVSYGNSLYVFGGDDGKQMLNDLVTYDYTNNSWGRALNVSPPTPRYHHTAVVYNNSMFLFGGYTGDLNSNSSLCNKNDLYEYRFATGNWILWNIESNTPTPRAAHGAVVYDHKLWIFAGYDGNSRLNDMWSINLNVSQNSTKVWTEIEQKGEQPPTVCNFPLTVVHDSMYLFSGQSGAKTSNLLFKFDFKTSTWSKISSNFLFKSANATPERRSGHIMVSHNNRLYIYGGILGNNFFTDVYSFDLESKSWDLIVMNSKSQIPSGRSFLAACVQNDNLYVFGGNGEQTKSNELYRLKLPNQPKSTLKDDFFNIYKNELFCDLKLICSDGQIILAHCAIVACRSSYCRQMIRLAKEKLTKPNCLEETNKTKCPPFIIEANEYIEINLVENSNSKALRLVLEFIYTDQINSLNGRENDLETLKLMVDIYKLAYQVTFIHKHETLTSNYSKFIIVKFVLPKLKKLCENYVETSINCTNILGLLRYVDSLGLNTLKGFCMKFLAKDSNFNQVIMLNEFEHLQSPLMVEIIRLKQTNRKLNIFEQVVEPNQKITSLEEDMASFLLSDIGNEFADIFILLNENAPPLPAHKSILASRCAYFEAYFRSFKPKDHKIMMTIGDIMPPRQACISLLKYIYHDEINMPAQDALYLFSASHYFQFSNLRLYTFCKQTLESNVSKENIFEILEVADKLADENMKNFALRIIRMNFSDLAHSSRIKKLSKELLLDIIADIGKTLNKPNTNSPSNSLSLIPSFMTQNQLNYDDLTNSKS